MLHVRQLQKYRGSRAVMLAWTLIAVGSAVGQPAAPPAAGGSLEPQYRESWADYIAQKSHARPAKLPDWSGIWRRSGNMATFMGFGEGQPPNPALGMGYAKNGADLTPKYQAAYEKKVENIKNGKEWDRLSSCLPAGMPRWLTEPWLREFIVTPTVTFLILEQMSEVRRIYTDGRAHRALGDVGTLWEGESVGFWDGSDLVIHTAHIKAGEYQRGQADYSFKTSTVERWHPVDANTINVDVTVYDPESLRHPLKAPFVFKKVQTQWVNFTSCDQGNNAVMTADGSTTFVLPGEPGYKDPDKIGIPEVALDSFPK